MNLDMYVQMLNLYFNKEVRFRPWRNGCILGKVDFFEYKGFYWEIMIKPVETNITFTERQERKFLASISIIKSTTNESINWLQDRPFCGYVELLRFISNFLGTSVIDKCFLELNTDIKVWLDKCINPIKDNRIVNDYTFARRLLSYLTDTEGFAMTGPHHYEEYDYLRTVVKRLLDYQKATVTDEEECSYFERMNE